MNDEFQNQDPNEEKEELRKLFPLMSPVTAAFFGLAAVFILYQFGGALLTIIIFGLNFEKADVNAIRLLTMGGQILFILLPTLLLAKLIYQDVTTILRVKFPNKKEVAVFAGGMVILAPLLQSFLYIQNYIIIKLAESSSLVQSLKNLIDQIDKLVQSTYGNLLTSHSFFEGSFIVFVVAVTPALCEEVFFRGFVQKSFELKYKPIWSILLTALFFGMYHFNPYGLIALIGLGAYFGFTAYMSNSIFIPMILHFLNNLFSVLVYFVFGDEDMISASATASGDIIPQIISFFVLLVLFSAFIFFVKKNYSRFVNN